MNSKVKNIVFGGMVAGCLIASAGPVMAWDWPWARHDERSAHQTDKWDEHWGRGKDYEEYQQARQQALYDASHGASRKKIAEDDARADEILNRGRHGH